MTIAAVLALVVPALLAGCAGTGPVQRDSESVELGDAESVRVEIAMGVGALLIGGGAEKLMEADFTYSHEGWKPELEYAVTGDRGLLSVRQPSVMVAVPIPSVRFEWDLRFNRDIPMDMNIEMGVGGGDLDLGDLNLRNLELHVGVGGAEIDLSGDWESDLEATSEGGVGGVKLRLPRDVGVRVQVDKGQGAVEAEGFSQEGDVYTNDAYGRTDVTLDIRLELGVGGAELVLAD